MVELKDIPAEVRWEIAAKSATAMPWAYGMVFQDVVGKERFYEISRQIWKQGGLEAKKLADHLNLPARNAREVNNAWAVVSGILYGPEFKEDIIEETEDRMVIRITSCPFLNRAIEMGINPKDSMGPCQAYSRSLVENLNAKYTQSFISGMCLGDKYCENVIELKR